MWGLDSAGETWEKAAEGPRRAAPNSPVSLVVEIRGSDSRATFTRARLRWRRRERRRAFHGHSSRGPQGHACFGLSLIRFGDEEPATRAFLPEKGAWVARPMKCLQTGPLGNMIFQGPFGVWYHTPLFAENLSPYTNRTVSGFNFWPTTGISLDRLFEFFFTRSCLFLCGLGAGK